MDDNEKLFVIRDSNFKLNKISSDVTKVVYDSFFDVNVINRIIQYLKDNNIPATIVCQMPLYSLGGDVLSKISDKNMVYLFPCQIVKCLII